MIQIFVCSTNVVCCCMKSLYHLTEVLYKVLKIASKYSLTRLKSQIFAMAM